MGDRHCPILEVDRSEATPGDGFEHVIPMNANKPIATQPAKGPVIAVHSAHRCGS